MTTYIPALTFPRFAFAQPAVAILLPVVCGAGIGYATRRMFIPPIANVMAYLADILPESRPDKKNIWEIEAAPAQPSGLAIWASVDEFVRRNGLYRI